MSYNGTQLVPIRQFQVCRNSDEFLSYIEINTIFIIGLFISNEKNISKINTVILVLHRITNKNTDT